MNGFNFFETILADSPKAPTKLPSRTFRGAIEEALIHTYTRSDLEMVFAEALGTAEGLIDTFILQSTSDCQNCS